LKQVQEETFEDNGGEDGAVRTSPNNDSIENQTIERKSRMSKKGIAAGESMYDTTPQKKMPNGKQYTQQQMQMLRSTDISF
jgi:hypothetical protein